MVRPESIRIEIIFPSIKMDLNMNRTVSIHIFFGRGPMNDNNFPYFVSTDCPYYCSYKQFTCIQKNEIMEKTLESHRLDPCLPFVYRNGYNIHWVWGRNPRFSCELLIKLLVCFSYNIFY